MKNYLLLMTFFIALLFGGCKDSVKWDESQLCYEFDYATHTAVVVKTPNDYPDDHSVASSGWIPYGYSDYSGNIAIPQYTSYLNEKYEVVRIKEGAFGGCRELRSLKIPKTVINIDAYAILCSPNLDIIVVDSDNPKYDSRHDCNAVIETATSTLLFGSNKSIITKDIKIIGSYSFMRMNLESLEMSEGIDKIDHHTLWKLPKLRTIEIPNSVTFLGENVLSYCDTLESIVLGSGIKTLDYDVLRECPRLTKVICKAIIPPACYSNVFAGLSKETILYVPSESISAYKSDNVWGTRFKEIQPITSNVQY